MAPDRRIEGGQTCAGDEHHPEVFGQVFCNLIRAGDAGGHLADVLVSLSEFDEVGGRTRFAHPASCCCTRPSWRASCRRHRFPVGLHGAAAQLFGATWARRCHRNPGDVFVSDLMSIMYLFLAIPLAAFLIGLQMVRSNPLAACVSTSQAAPAGVGPI
jgi:hypothetical protein